MRTRMLVIRPNYPEFQEMFIALPKEPNNAQLEKWLLPFIFEGRKDSPRQWKEHVTVLCDGERRDMFVDEEGHISRQPFNLEATRIYHAASIARGDGKPNAAGIIEGAPLIVGVAVLFPDRQVWF